MSAPSAQPEPPHHGGLLGALQPLLELLVIFLFVTTFLFQTTRIPSPSMVPTLRVGDLLLIDKQSFSAPAHGSPQAPQNLLARLLPPTVLRHDDLAVFHFPDDPTVYLVKRVIGLSGDRLVLHNGVVFRNGTALVEPYATHDPGHFNVFRDDFPSFLATDPKLDPLWWAILRRTVRDGELTVPADRVFVLGDNRDNSEDSRYWGFVPMENMVGRPLVVLFPAVSEPTAPPTLRTRVSRALHAIHVVR